MEDVLDRLRAAVAGRYEIQRQIGEGGMATVHLARDLRHERSVALKVLRPELSAILGGERFLNEIKVTANLQHPHILPLYDSGSVDSFLYYVMPYVDGESLRDRLTRERQLGVDETLRIAEAVASALDYAHQRDVVHRDIKPENILLQGDQALVADFGIALAVSHAGGTRLTETGLSLGTPHYMSPEQATGDREIDARSDIYSLGSVVYEMLVGEPPHVGNSVQAIIARILSETPASITQTRDLVPPHVDAAVHKALARSPADRFSGAAEFARALADPSFRLPTAAVATAEGRAGSPWNRLTVASAGLAVIMAVVATIGWMRGPDASATSIHRNRIALPPEERFLFNDNTIEISPDGEAIVYVAGIDQLERQLFVKQRGQLDPQPIPGTREARAPYFSPDGQRVAFFWGTESIRTVALTGEPPVTILDSGAVSAGGAAWSADGYHYYTSDETLGIFRIPEWGGPPEAVTTVDESAEEVAHFFPQPTDDGNTLIFAVGYRGQDPFAVNIAAIDLRSGSRADLVRAVHARVTPTGHLVFVRADGALLAAPFDAAALSIIGAATPLFDGVRVKAGGMIDLGLSRNGTLVYVSGEAVTSPYGVGELVWVDRSGRQTAVDPDWTFPLPYNRSLALSSDGTRLALDILGETADLWVKQLDRGPLTRITFEGSQNTGVTWTADGERLTFASNRAAGPDIYVRRGDGIGDATLLVDHERAAWDGTWSPDGEWFVFRTGGTVNERDYWAIRPSVDSVPALLLQTPYDEMHASISPDGNWLAYTSNESGRNEVYVRPFPNVDDGRTQVSQTGGTQPVWAPTQRELYYQSADGELISVDVTLGNAFTVGDRRSLFRTADWIILANTRTYYAVAPDNQRFLMVREVEGSDRAADVVLVENWFEELEQKVPLP